jgi:hypothetical protein
MIEKDMAPKLGGFRFGKSKYMTPSFEILFTSPSP